MMWLKAFIIAGVVTAASLLYAFVAHQFLGARPDEWAGFGVMVFIPWLLLVVMYQKAKNIKHIGVSRLFIVVGILSGVIGVTTSKPHSVPEVASLFSFYGVVGFTFCLMAWWVIRGFMVKHNESSTEK